MFGLFWGGWAACLPAIQDATGASNAQLGLALLAVAFAALPAMLAAGRLSDALGTRLVPVALVVLGLAAMLPALAGSVRALVLLLLFVGIGTGLLDVAINADASRIESALGVRLMNGMHAAFSIGVLVGAVTAGLLRKEGAHASWILAGFGLVIVATAAANRGSGERMPRALSRTRPGRNLLAIGAVLAIAFLVENGLEGGARSSSSGRFSRARR